MNIFDPGYILYISNLGEYLPPIYAAEQWGAQLYSNYSYNASQFCGYLVPTNEIVEHDMVTGQKTQTKFTMKESLFLLGQNQQDIKDILNRFKKANVS
ncbi:unnamed protein product, partial [Callosobruchus maculatus]